MKAMNIQDYILSIPLDNFNDHHVLVIDLTSMQDATEHSLSRSIWRTTEIGALL